MHFKSKNYTFNLELGPLVMGILNVTPDSFADNAKNFTFDAALTSAQQMIKDGVDIIDIGGESTRPGSNAVDVEEELKRVIPIIKAIRAESEIAISIDTWKSEVAGRAIEAGADIINDISGFQRDPEMKHVAAANGVGCIAMHMRGTPQTMMQFTEYDDLIQEMFDYFQVIIDDLTSLGIEKESICLDPGIGFSKNTAQNLLIINKLSSFTSFGVPVLLGPSKKSFIGQTLNLEKPDERDWGTAAAVACGIYRGATILRVHDVKEMKQVIDMTMAILNSKED